MSDLSTKVLIEIRDEIKSTKDQLSGRLDVLAKRQTESELRVTTELVAVRDSVDRVVELLRSDRSLRGDVQELKARVTLLEQKTR